MTHKASMHPCNSIRVVVLHRTTPHQTHVPLCDQGGSGGALVPPGRGKGTDGLVVAGKTVDTGLNENEAATPSQSSHITLHEETYNLESLSLRLPDKCLRTATAFLINM